jgi:hypothetical protein
MFVNPLVPDIFVSGVEEKVDNTIRFGYQIPGYSAESIVEVFIKSDSVDEIMKNPELVDYIAKRFAIILEIQQRKISK